MKIVTIVGLGGNGRRWLEHRCRLEKEAIIEAIKRLKPKGKQREVFGNGKAAERITEIMS